MEEKNVFSKFGYWKTNASTLSHVTRSRFLVFRFRSFEMDREPTLLNFVKDQLKSAGYITYDATTGKWTGVDYKKRGGEK